MLAGMRVERRMRRSTGRLVVVLEDGAIGNRGDVMSNMRLECHHRSGDSLGYRQEGDGKQREMYADGDYLQTSIAIGILLRLNSLYPVMRSRKKADTDSG